MRTLIAAAALFAISQTALADDAVSLFGQDAPAAGYTGGLGLITTLGPTGLFQNATSGIAPKYAFSIESCMAFKQNNGDHFQSNGVLLTYGVTDWLEVGGFGLFAHGLDPIAAGDDNLQMGQVHARIRLMRDEGGLPEVTIGGIVGFGDDPLAADSVFLSASKGFKLSDGDVMRSVRFHAGFRETLPHIGDDITTGFGGIELEVYRNLFMIGEINIDDNSYQKTQWSAGLQYRSNAFGFSAAVLQDPFESDKTFYVGIGVSY